MPKLYVFGIGGTGSRVMKSLTMLLASGVKLGKFDTVVPLFIDPDGDNGDLNATLDLINSYQKIRDKIGASDRSFFATNIKTLPQLSAENNPALKADLKFNFDGAGKKFGDFIGYDSLGQESKDLIGLLFSKKNLNADITVGFKGNPNIGSIVLNNFIGSKEYTLFKNSFNNGDCIYIVSSIFGGTGASGFPLLLKNLRLQDAKDEKIQLINKSKIGALSVLPYFKVETPDNGAVDSGTFMGKTKAALKYYKHAIIEKKLLDSFYSLGADTDFQVDYAEGKGDQKNPAHIIELIGALSIKDFAVQIEYLEDELPKKSFGFVDAEKPFNKQNVQIDNIPPIASSYFTKELSRLFLFYSFMSTSRNVLLDSKGEFNNNLSGIAKEEWNSNFAKQFFNPFFSNFSNWVSQLAKTPDWKFDLYHQDKEHKELLGFIKGKEIKNSLFSKPASADRVIEDLNKQAKNGDFKDDNPWSRMFKMFTVALNNQINQLIK